MSRYVDVDKLKAHARTYWSDSEHPYDDLSVRAFDAVSVEEIDAMPTVDVEELENKIKSMEAVIRANERRIDYFLENQETLIKMNNNLRKELDSSTKYELLGWRKK